MINKTKKTVTKTAEQAAKGAMKAAGTLSGKAKKQISKVGDVIQKAPGKANEQVKKSLLSVGKWTSAVEKKNEKPASQRSTPAQESATPVVQEQANQPPQSPKPGDTAASSTVTPNPVPGQQQGVASTPAAPPSAGGETDVAVAQNELAEAKQKVADAQSNLAHIEQEQGIAVPPAPGAPAQPNQPQVATTQPPVTPPAQTTVAPTAATEITAPQMAHAQVQQLASSPAGYRRAVQEPLASPGAIVPFEEIDGELYMFYGSY
eukprot:748077_1